MISDEVIRSLVFHEKPDTPIDGLFRLVGMVHLFTASGIHLLALYEWVRWIVKSLGRLLGENARFAENLSLGLFLLVAFWVWRREGFHFSLFRPLVTILIRALAARTGHQIPIFLPLLFTFALEALLSVSQGVSPGAIHYYLAVGGGLIALIRREGAAQSGPLLHLRMAVYSWVPIALLDLFRDRWIAPWTPILSVLTIPPVSLFFYPQFILFERDLSHGFEGFLNLIESLMDWVPPGFQVDPKALIFAPLFVVLSRAFKGFGLKRFVFLILLIPLRYFCIDPEVHASSVIQFDVGQGDSAMLLSAQGISLVDVGGDRGQSPEAWVRRLSRSGARRVDTILLTHLDQDHVGGLGSILPVTQVKCIELSPHHLRTPKGMALRAWLLRNYPEVRTVQEGCFTGTRVEWFSSRRPGAKGNEWMAGVFHELHGGWGYFAIGDGDREQELQFERRFQSDIRSHPYRIWKVSHHGSRFSSDSGFLSRLSPKEAWISVGRRNPYHHPAPVVLEGLRSLAGITRRTDREGDLTGLRDR